MERLSPEKIKEAFRSAQEGEPLFRALMQTITEFFEDECKAAIQPTVTGEDRAYNCGRAQSIADLRDFIVNVRSLTREDSGSNSQAS